MKQKLCQSLNEITPVVTAHEQGEKFIFLSADDTQTAITQLAYGKLLPGESIGEHLHATMEECFYFISGQGEFVISNISYNINPGTFFRIPAATTHSLKASGSAPLTFVYFGVAIQ